MITSTPIRPSLQKSRLRIEEIAPDIRDESTVLGDETSLMSRSLYDSRGRESSLSRSHMTLREIPPEARARHLTITTLPVESISPETTRSRDFGTNTERRTLQCSRFLIEDIAPLAEARREIKKRSCGTSTSLTMGDVLTREDASALVDDALRIRERKDTSSRGVQCVPEVAEVVVVPVVEKRDQAVQMNERFRMRSHVSVTARPRTAEVGVEVKLGPSTRSVCVGPDPAVAARPPVSLNSMNSRSHSFDYGDTRSKPRKRTATGGSGSGRSVAVMVDDLIRTSSRATDTAGLAPDRREFGTSPMKRKYVDVSVGDSVRPHISISCAANYCDNCKETIKSLAKQIANNAENSLNHQNNAGLVSRIPRPSHIPLNSGDHRRQFKRQDTYTKLPAAGVIRYDADNREQYDNSDRLVIEDLREIYIFTFSLARPLFAFAAILRLEGILTVSSSKLLSILANDFNVSRKDSGALNALSSCINSALVGKRARVTRQTRGPSSLILLSR